MHTSLRPVFGMVIEINERAPNRAREYPVNQSFSTENSAAGDLGGHRTNYSILGIVRVVSYGHEILAVSMAVIKAICSFALL